MSQIIDPTESIPPLQRLDPPPGSKISQPDGRLEPCWKSLRSVHESLTAVSFVTSRAGGLMHSSKFDHEVFVLGQGDVQAVITLQASEVERFWAFRVKVKCSANIDYGGHTRTGKPNQISRHQVDPLMQIATIGSYQWSLQAGLTLSPDWGQFS